MNNSTYKFFIPPLYTNFSRWEIRIYSLLFLLEETKTAHAKIEQKFLSKFTSHLTADKLYKCFRPYIFTP